MTDKPQAAGGALVERLRNPNFQKSPTFAKAYMFEAAREIERLSALTQHEADRGSVVKDAVAECLAGLLYSEVSQDARRKIEAAIDRALASEGAAAMPVELAERLRALPLCQCGDPDAWAVIEEAAAALTADAGSPVSEAPVGCHPSHKTRGSDASSYDEICVYCGATDTIGGWGGLAHPCPAPGSDKEGC